MKHITLCILLSVSSLLAAEYQGEWYLLEESKDSIYYYHKSRTKDGKLTIRETNIFLEKKAYSQHTFHGIWKKSENGIIEIRDLDPFLDYDYRMVKSAANSISFQDYIEEIPWEGMETENNEPYIFVETTQKIDKPEVEKGFKKVPSDFFEYTTPYFMIEKKDFEKKTNNKFCRLHEEKMVSGNCKVSALPKKTYDIGQRIFSQSAENANVSFPLVKGMHFERQEMKEFKVPTNFCQSCRSSYLKKHQDMIREAVINHGRE